MSLLEPATMSASGYCPRCREFKVIAKTCRCQRFECGIPFRGEVEDWDEIFAQDAEGAAEKDAERRDSDGDYTIVSQGEAEIWTRDYAGTVEKWMIEARSEPHYYAHKKRESPVPTVETDR
jgi:hypothetical protein